MKKQSNPLKDRLDQELSEKDIEEIKEHFVSFLAETDTDPRNTQVTKDLVEALIEHMSKANPDWEGLPAIEEIWSDEAIDHLRSTLRNQKREKCKPLLEKIRQYKEA